MPKKPASRTPTRTERALALARQRDRDQKAALIARGLCRQCGKTRGASPSVSRCIRCYRLAREQMRQAAGSVPWRNARHGGRRPLDWQEETQKARRKREAVDPFRVPIDRSEG